MKHFIFTKQSSKTGRNGGRTLTFSVHQIVNNELEYCGEFKESSGSYKGDQSAVMNHLGKTGKIDAKYAEGYYKHENGDFKLTEL